MANVTETVGSFLQSFLTLGGDDAAEEAPVQEVTVEPMDIVDTAGRPVHSRP